MGLSTKSASELECAITELEHTLIDLLDKNAELIRKQV